MSASAPIELDDTSSEDEIEIVSETQNNSLLETQIAELKELVGPLPNPELANRGKFKEDAIDIDSDIESVHTIVDADYRKDSNWDSDVSVEELISSEEEDDDESISFSEFLLRQIRARFRGDRSSMPQTDKRTREAVIDPPKATPETRPYSSIEQEAEAWKKDHEKQDDECLLLIDEAARKKIQSRQRKKKKRLRNLQRKKRKQLRKMAIKEKRNKKEFHIQSSEKPYHIQGDYLDDPCYDPQPRVDRVTLIMTDTYVAQCADNPPPLEKGWISYKDRFQQYRAIPRYIVDQRMKETEEVVRLLQKPSYLPFQNYVRDYIAILMRLSTRTVNTILKKIEKEKTRNKIIPFEVLFCPRCQIYGCTIHGLVDAQNYSYDTAQEVAMRKEESGYWKQAVGDDTSLICAPCNDKNRSSDNAKDLSHSEKLLAKRLYFIYQGDLDKVSNILGASKQTIRKVVRSEKGQPGVTYHFLENEKENNQRFLYSRKGQEYFDVYVEDENTDSKEDKMEKKDVKISEYVPCIHAGSCSREICPCMQNKYPCTNYCILGPLSPNFFPGCECKSQCLTNSCPCHAGGRECDPDLCKNCQTCRDPEGAGKEERKKICRNNNIRMRRQIKGLYYAKSREIPDAGWGVFCNKFIPNRSYIGEYVGEYLSEAEAAKRKEDNQSITYLFDLPGNHCIDAIRQGNITRYFNHKFEKEKPNVCARVKIVNGDPRIAFYAKRDIPAGTEMFFNYGRKYKTAFGAPSANIKNAQPVPATVDV